MNDDKLAIEEARRAGQHGSVKAQVEGEVQAEIADSAAVAPPAETERIEGCRRLSRQGGGRGCPERTRSWSRARSSAHFAGHRLPFLCALWIAGSAIPARLDGRQERRRLRSVYRGGNESVLRAFSWHRGQSANRRWAHPADAAGDCVHCLPVDPSRDQWVAAHLCASQDSSLVIGDFQLPIVNLFGNWQIQVGSATQQYQYREAVTARSPGLLQPWGKVRESSTPTSRGCANGRNRFAVDSPV